MTTASALDVMSSRRSTRKFKPDVAVPRETLEKIVHAARCAPTGMNRQEIRFTVVASPSLVHAIGGECETVALPKFPHLQKRKDEYGCPNAITYGATALIVLSYPADQTWAVIDAGFCAQNVLLAAEALGLGAVPVGIAGAVNEAGIKLRLKIPENEKIALCIPIGVPDPEYAAKFKPAKELTSQVVWFQ